MPRRLFRADSSFNLLEVTCPSTGTVYHLRVPPELASCQAAVAWTFARDSPDYAPLVET